MPLSSLLPGSRIAQVNLSTYDLHSLDPPSLLMKYLFMNSGNITILQRRVNSHFTWFLEFLEIRFNSLPEELKSIGQSQVTSTSISFDHFQDIAANICNTLASTKHVSLIEMAERLVQDHLVTDDPSRLENVQQLVFAVIGMLSMLFAPSTSYADGKITIDMPQEYSPRSRPSDTWAVNEQRLDDASGSLIDTICSFSGVNGPIPYASGMWSNLDDVNTLATQNLNFFILAKLGGISIQWTDSICLHLVLNRRDKTLLMFQHPSFCALLAQSHGEQNFLDRLFHDYFVTLSKPINGQTPAGDFLRELLLTYRLLFGQDRRSWRFCRTEGIIPTNSLLYRLCCQDWEEEPLYDNIDAPSVRTLYSAYEDFTFFGERLMELQQYVKLLEPNGWRTLYYDRRNVNRHCTIWVAIVFGALTFTLSLLAVILSAAQVAGTF